MEEGSVRLRKELLDDLDSSEGLVHENAYVKEDMAWV